MKELLPTLANLIFTALMALLLLVLGILKLIGRIRRLVKVCKGIKKMQEIPQTRPDAIRMRASNFQAENYTKAIVSNIVWTVIWFGLTVWLFGYTGRFWPVFVPLYVLMGAGSALKIPYNLIARKYGEYGYLFHDCFVNLVAEHKPPKTKFTLSEEHGEYEKLYLQLHANPKHPEQVTRYEIIERQDEARQIIAQLADVGVKY